MKSLEDRVARAYIEACLAELDAPKPGNVHRFAPGHRMEVADFIRSAEVSAASIAARGARVGIRVRAAVDATLSAVGQNTNLGIILLCAPLAAAGEVPDEALRPALAGVLDRLDQADARDVFSAIAAANPGGLGRAARHDVNAPAVVTLREAMAEAADRDRIARQYVTAYEDIFSLGLPALKRAAKKWEPVFREKRAKESRALGDSGESPRALAAARRRRSEPRWATLGVYLTFLAAAPDTHITRKFDLGVAEAVRREAADWRDAFLSARDPERIAEGLLSWDAALKSRGINPGTSADLTVATLFAAGLSAIRGDKSAPAILPLRANDA
jgi:triphosphoribosyl-dephospho-CoA synthase